MIRPSPVLNRDITVMSSAAVQNMFPVGTQILVWLHDNGCAVQQFGVVVGYDFREYEPDRRMCSSRMENGSLTFEYHDNDHLLYPHRMVKIRTVDGEMHNVHPDTLEHNRRM